MSPKELKDYRDCLVSNGTILVPSTSTIEVLDNLASNNIHAIASVIPDNSYLVQAYGPNNQVINLIK